VSAADLPHYVGSAHDPEEPDADRTAGKAKDPNAATPATQQPKSGSPASETGAALPGLPKTGGQELSQTLKDQFSPVVGSLDHIRVHDTPHSHAATAHIGAEGFIDGPNIHLSKGADQQTVIPHELGHVPQKSKKIRRKAASDSWAEKQAQIQRERAAEKERQRIAAEKERKRLAKLESDRKAAETNRKNREAKDKRLAAVAKIKEKALLEKYGPDYKPPVKAAVKTVPRPKTDLSAIKEKALREKAEQKQAQLREQTLKHHPGILNVLKQPMWGKGAIALGETAMHSDVGVKALKGARQGLLPAQTKPGEPQQKTGGGWWDQVAKVGAQAVSGVTHLGQKGLKGAVTSMAESGQQALSTVVDLPWKAGHALAQGAQTVGTRAQHRAQALASKAFKGAGDLTQAGAPAESVDLAQGYYTGSEGL
jgi:Domain of unknown function (DUF4157)